MNDDDRTSGLKEAELALGNTLFLPAGYGQEHLRCVASQWSCAAHPFLVGGARPEGYLASNDQLPKGAETKIRFFAANPCAQILNYILAEMHTPMI
jgi:hypothetical protein